MKFFTGYEQYGFLHKKRPFETVEEMEEELIKRNNKLVKSSDVVFHLGNFSSEDKKKTHEIIRRLKGKHVFLRGGNDRWMKKNFYLYEIKVEKLSNNDKVVLCSYPLRNWPLSHFNSYHVYANRYIKNEKFFGKTMNVSVECNDYYPFSEEEIIDIMDLQRGDNYLFLTREERWLRKKDTESKEN